MFLLLVNETSSAFARERASRLERKNFDDEFLKDLSKDGKLKNSDNALVPLHPPQLRPNEARSNLETLRHEYLAQPGTTQSSTVQIQQEGVVYSWMVDHQVHHERLRFRGMGFRRRELNRSLDDGLALESPRNSFHSSRNSGSKKDRSSGIFSLFQWFRKQKSEDSSDLDVSSGPNSPVLPRAASITGSADTLFSTATANSFAFVHPLQYRPFGSANQPEIRIAVGPETNTYRNRIRERERLRYQERHISLREKYRLYASGTLPRSADHINELSDERLFDIKQSFDLPGNRFSTLGRKKRKAPPPPSFNNSCSENSLPAVFDQNITETNLVKQHRRSSSEPVKYLKQQCHVKGKRKAPQPPGHNIGNDPDIISLSTTNSNSSKRSKKKRRAPSPPIKKSASGDEHIVTIIREATDEILSNKNPVSQKEDLRDETLSNASTLDIGSSEDVVCTDTLKLERGILKPNMDKTFPEHRINPSSPVSPRPWYKRTTVNREMGSMREKEKRKERDRRKVEDWMLESGFPRRSILNTDNRNSMYSKAEKSDEKRKSQISILTNISELDREAAEIIRRGKEKEKTLIETHNAMYFSNAESVSGNDMVINNIVQETETPKKKSTKELITLFNAITNVTKVTVNSSFFSRDSSNFLSKDKKTKVLSDREMNNKPSSSSVREIETVDEIIIKQTSSKNVASPLETDKPGTSSGSSSASEGKIARVTIEELDEYDAERNSKSQVLYEANRQNRHLSPPIPTITEVSEGSAKSSPTSTIASATNSDSVSEPVPEPVHMRHMNVWVCPRCTLENLRWRITCEACDMWRPNPFELRERSNQNQLATKKSTTENKNDIEKKETTSNHIYPNLTKLEVIKNSNSDFNKPPNQENRTDVTKEVKEKEVHESKVNKNTVIENEAKIKVGIDIENVNNKTSVEVNKETEGVTTQEKEDNLFDNQTEEVRKARLAFFTKTNLDNNENIQVQSGPVVSKDTNKSTPFIISDDEEKRKLKDMLIEMKHSLPKRPKPVRSSEQGGNEGGNKDKMSSVKPNSSAVEMLKASQPTSKVINVVSNNSTSSENKAEAYLVESETVIEEIKIKKPLEKVSSSVQTSGLIKQISPKPVAPSSKEVHIPIKVEEHVIKDGILYTTVSKDTRRIGTGTFELLRPRDFANIEAIKTDSKQSPIHLYANIANNEASDKEVKTEESTLNKLEYIDKLSKQLTRPQGVANFKARMDMSNDKNVNTLAVNRLLKRLEVAIAGGNHELAATLARELAQLKVNCSVIRQKPEAPGQEILVEMFVEDKASHQGPFPIKLKPSLTVRELKDRIEREYEIPIGVQRWILGKQLAADDESSLGDMGINTDGCPIFLYLVAPESIQPKVTGEPAITFHIPKLATNTVVNIDISEKDLNEAGPSGVNTKTAAKSNECNQQNAKITPETETKTDLNPVGTLALGWKCVACTLMNSPTRPGCAACTTERPKDYKVPTEYKLSDTEVSRIDNELVSEKETTKAEEEEKAKNYQKLVDLEKDDLIIYTEAFECPVCLTDYPPMDGIVLRECLHVFCRNCIANTIRYSEEAEVKCPFRDNNYTCDSTLLQREIKALVPPEIYEEHLAKSIALAETKIGNAFHCKTPDCKGWCIYEDNVNTFRCPVCTHTNCLTCQAIHEGLDCKQFQEQLNKDSDMNIEAKRTKEMLQEMVDRGEAMNCPTCQVVLMKKWGCDWLRCSMCKTEICWVTRGPRWGPNGKGDTSGGCQCGVNGIKCHPKCTYCH